MIIHGFIQDHKVFISFGQQCRTVIQTEYKQKVKICQKWLLQLPYSWNHLHIHHNVLTRLNLLLSVFPWSIIYNIFSNINRPFTINAITTVQCNPGAKNQIYNTFQNFIFGAKFAVSGIFVDVDWLIKAYRSTDYK